MINNIVIISNQSRSRRTAAVSETSRSGQEFKLLQLVEDDTVAAARKTDPLFSIRKKYTTDF